MAAREMIALRFILALLLVSLAGPARADDAQTRAFVQEVLARNPTLRSRQLARESVSTRASAEGYWPDPKLSVMLDRVPERMDGEMPMLRYEVTQMIMWPGKLRLMEEAVEQQASGAAADVEVRKRELIREAEQAHLMLAQNRAYREITEAARRLLDTVSRAAIARYGAGSGGHHEVARAEVERSATELEAVSLEGERVSIVAMLNALRDRPADAPLAEPTPAASAPPALALAELVRLALERRPELRRMNAMASEETTMAALARRERYPDFMAGLWYNQMLGGADTVGVMVGANIPVFSASSRSRRARSAELAASSTRSELTAMRAMIRFQVTDALQRVTTATRALELVTHVARPRAEESFSSALAVYAAGSAELVAVLDAWRALQRLERARVDAVVAQSMALIDLEWATGGPVSGDSR